MTYTQSKYFKKGLQMNMAGFERLDEIFGKANKSGATKDSVIYNISAVFDLKGARLTKFLKQLDLSDYK